MEQNQEHEIISLPRIGDVALIFRPNSKLGLNVFEAFCIS